MCVCWHVGTLDVYTCHADVMHSILILASTRVPIRRQSFHCERKKKNTTGRKLGHKQFLGHFNLKTSTNSVFSTVGEKNPSALSMDLVRELCEFICVSFFLSSTLNYISFKQFMCGEPEVPQTASRSRRRSEPGPPARTTCCVQ